MRSPEGGGRKPQVSSRKCKDVHDHRIPAAGVSSTMAARTLYLTVHLSQVTGDCRPLALMLNCNVSWNLVVTPLASVPCPSEMACTT
jgi:hypothetical protein